uniref:Cytochrome c oxidase subunit 2 n=1 Tax=Archivesica marissinica TaxID=2291877 RepID=A0A5C1H8Q8_9BIVA|nr:cytochrome c oxidase subunit II [Archivesica marissinica]QEM01941.1 cytochrome c oxidase subunit II [Archivesica marissinica]UZA66426.1 cytochrome c oxidase subunit II [Archivesica marissinica]UZA66439.1 cytochrome c oxidase subunit II [Archivesica marissinica]
MGSWNKLWFFDMNTVVGQELILYNDLVMVVAVAVLVVVGWFMLLFLNSRTFFGGKMNKYVYHNELLEIMWTMVPAFMLCFLGYVSLMNLYIMEVGDHVENGMKVTAHQWYWEYSYIVDFSGKEKEMDELWLANWFEQLDFNFEISPELVDVVEEDGGFAGENSFEGSEVKNSDCLLEVFESGGAGVEEMKLLESISSWVPHIFLNSKWNYSYEVYEVFNSSVLDQGNFRGYTVTDACYLMSSVKNEMLISTMDVMHSWGVGSLGVKCDAVPGRVNSLGISPLRSGVFYGNCYELCGEGHSMMPISVAVMTPEDVSLVLKQGVLGTSDCASTLERVVVK